MKKDSDKIMSFIKQNPKLSPGALEKILLERFKNKLEIYKALNEVYPSKEIEKKFRKALTAKIKSLLAKKNLYSIRKLYQTTDERLFNLAIDFLIPVEKEVLKELINLPKGLGREELLEFIEDKLFNFDPEEYLKYEIYCYIALELESKKVNDFFAYMLREYDQTRYLKKISKGINRYGEEKVCITDEFIRLMLFKYASFDNLEIVRNLLKQYNDIVFSDFAKEHLKLHENMTLDDEGVMKSIFYENPFELIKNEFAKKEKMDVYYDSYKNNIIVYIKCKRVIGESSKYKKLNTIKIILNNVGKVITAYPTQRYYEQLLLDF